MSKFWEVVFTIIATMVMGFTFAVLVVEWAAGCGETYIDAYGKRHAYECVFIPTPMLREEAKRNK